MNVALPAMHVRTVFAAVVLVFAPLSVACSAAPKPQPPAPSAPKVEASKPSSTPTAAKTNPPPPTPKCEAIAEQCIAEKKTRARIAAAGALLFTPPEGWTYAQESGASVAQTSNDGAAVALAATNLGEPTTDGKKLDHARDALLESLAERLGVTMPKHKIVWKKSDKTVPVGALQVGLYQLEGAQRNGKKGPLLVFTAPISPELVLVGIGFVNDDDDTDADGSILEAIKTIAPAPGLDDEKKP